MPADRVDKLRRDAAHVDAVLLKLGRLVRKRVGRHAYTRISVVITDGALTDVIEERREHAESADLDSW